VARHRKVIIAGAGPAGISAAIFLVRAGFDPLLLEQGLPGGLMHHANLIESYPGFPGGVEGPDLAERFCDHLKKVGGSIVKAKVTGVKPGDGGRHLVSSSLGEFDCKALIIATGTQPIQVEIQGAHGMLDRRIFYDLTGLIALAGIAERVVVYGGGDAAFDYGMNLVKRGFQVTVLCRSEPRCLPLLRSRATEAGISVLEGKSIEVAKDREQKIVLELEGGKTIEADRLLIACGRTPHLELIDPTVRSRIRLTDLPETGVPGLYLAGDVVANKHRQVGIAVGSGISAAMCAARYLREEGSE
jgi:thioredoxin reductase (NADPH)